VVAARPEVALDRRGHPSAPVTIPADGISAFEAAAVIAAWTELPAPSGDRWPRPGPTPDTTAFAPNEARFTPDRRTRLGAVAYDRLSLGRFLRSPTILDRLHIAALLWDTIRQGGAVPDAGAVRGWLAALVAGDTPPDPPALGRGLPAPLRVAVMLHQGAAAAGPSGGTLGGALNADPDDYESNSDS